MNGHLKKADLFQELEKNPNIAKVICDFYKIPLFNLNPMIEAGEIPGDAIQVCDRIYGRPSLHFFKFNLSVVAKDLKNKLSEHGGELTGEHGPYPNSFDFRISTYKWAEEDWIKWVDFLNILKIESGLEMANSNLPEKSF